MKGRLRKGGTHGAVLLMCLGLAGCTVGPNYKSPVTTVENQFGELSKTTGSDPAAQPSRMVNQSPTDSEWWRVFNDAELNRLIQEACQSNLQVRIATTRIREARAQRGVVAADLFPQINANAGYNHARGSKNVVLPFGAGGSGSGSAGGSRTGSDNSAQPRGKATPGDPPGDPPASGNAAGRATQSSGGSPLTPFGGGGLPGVTTDLYQLGFDSNWELDVFGGTRRRVEAATADLEASVQSLRDVMVTLLAEVGRNYLELRGTQLRLNVARENEAAQAQILQLTESMYQSGLVSQLDVARSAAEVATTTATIPPLEAQARSSIHALSILVGKEPNALSAELDLVKPLPNSPAQVPVGLPSELLRRRPDIRRAERQIAAATARIGSAKADLFPKFSITGSIGLDSSSLSHLLDWESHYFLVSPTVTWPVFSAGRIRSNIALQKANRDEALLEYRNSILVALREVEDGLVNYTTQQARRTALLEAVNQSQRALDLARDEYQHGLVDFLTVLDAQREVLTAQDARAQSDQTVATDLVALYKALGGGWDSKELLPRAQAPHSSSR